MMLPDFQYIVFSDHLQLLVQPFTIFTLLWIVTQNKQTCHDI